MKKYLNYSLMLMLFGVLFASCADEYKSYTPAKVTTDQVYFSNELSHDFELADFTETEITIPVSRQKADDEITVELGLTNDDDNFFTLKTKSVTFPVDALTADAVVTFDASKLDYDEYKSGTIYIVDAVVAPEELKLPDTEEDTEGTEEESSAPKKANEQDASAQPKYTTEWGNASFDFIVGVPAPFESLGMGKFSDAFWEEGECDVEILRNTINPNIYRLVDPYGSFGQSYYDDNRSKFMELQLLKPGDKLFDTEITKEDLVFFPEFNTGYLHSTYGAYIKLYHPAYMYEDEANFAGNRVAGYKDDGTPGEIDLAPYFYMDGVGGWNQTTNSGVVKIIFPGYAPKDYSLEVAYKGIFTDLGENPFAVVSAEFGEDVTTVKGLVVTEDADLDAVADAIEAGEVEAVDVDITNPGNILVPIAEDLTGKLQVVLVAVDEEGKVLGINSANFEYYGKGDANPWKSLGMGLYTDNLVAPLYSEEPVAVGPYEVEVQENSETPGLYRIVDAYAPGVHPWVSADDEDTKYTSASIEIDATDPDGVYILPQSTGLDWGYGVIYVASYGGYQAQTEDLAEVKAEGNLGKLEDGVITLPTLTNEKGNPYQGVHFDDDGGYLVGVADGFKLVLPEAVTSDARKRAIKRIPWMNYGRTTQTTKISKKDTVPFTKATKIR